VTPIQGGDLSYDKDRIDLQCVTRMGWRFVGRYVCNSQLKDLSKAEAERLAAAGLSIVTICQSGSAFMLKGRPYGVLLATRARAEATACGMPPDRPIYFALDLDPAPLTAAQWDQVRGFLAGAAGVLGKRWVGLYGAYEAIEALCPEWAPWGMQTYAWSGGKWSGKAQLQQYDNNVSVCGANVDRQRAVVADYGQWRPGWTPGGDWFGQASPEDLRRVVREELTAVIG